MGEEGSNHVLERVADVLARLGGDPRGARPRTGSARSDAPGVSARETEYVDRETEPADRETKPADPSKDAEPGRPVTDGGANEAPHGDVPWADDDPIVFGDEGDPEPGTAILDAVTDREPAAAPPFGDDAATDTDSATSVDATDSGDVDPDRLDELEARLDALESDHVQLESSLADVAHGVASIQEELSSTGEDVRLLVATLGGIAIAREGDESAHAGDGSAQAEDGSVPEATTDLAAALDGVDAAELASALAPHAESGEETAGAERTEDDSGSIDAVDDTDSVVADEDSESPDIDDAESPDTDGDSESPDIDDAESPDTDGDSDSPDIDDSESPETEDDPEVEADPTDDAAFDEATPPEGIHRGAGEPPSPATDDEPDTCSTLPADGETPENSADEAAGRTAAEPARELVDPRTEAVGARLRQFRDGFVDDPTADLPTGNTADEFRFDKVLLPTEGDAAPDLSNAALEKPYLETLPDGYAVDAVVLEWLDWLVSAADGEVAARAVVYYESIDWLTAEVRDDLLGYLEGLGEPSPRGETAGASRSDGATEPRTVEPPADLDLQDHLRSLQYVTELASGEVGSDGI